MLQAYTEYLRLLRVSRGLVFEVSFLNWEGKPERFCYKFSEAEYRHLQMWLCFATNACMIEKLWSDYFSALC